MKPRPGELGVVVGGGVQGIGEGGGDGMYGEGGTSGFGEGVVVCLVTQKVCVEESSCKLTTRCFPLEASLPLEAILILFLCFTKGSFFVGILTSSSLEILSSGS